MGFRNPVTSVGRVDTGVLANAGVRVYQDTSQTLQSGVVEFYSGTSPSAKITATPLITDLGDGSYSSVGSRTMFQGAGDGAHGIAGPSLELNVEEQPDSSYASVARINAQALFLPAGTQVGAQVLADTGWVPITLASGFTTSGTPQVRRVNGVLFFRNGWLSTGMAASSTFNVGTLPAGMAPAVGSYTRAGTASADQQGMFMIQTSGVIQVRTGATLASYYRMEAIGGIPAG